MASKGVYVPGNEYTVAALILVVDNDSNFKVVMRRTGEDMLELPSIVDNQDDYYAVADLVVDDLAIPVPYNMFKKGYKERIVLESPDLRRVYLVPAVTTEFEAAGLTTVSLFQLTKKNLSRATHYTPLTSGILNSQGAQSMMITLKSLHPSEASNKQWRKLVKSYGFDLSILDNTKWKDMPAEKAVVEKSTKSSVLYSNPYDMLDDC